VGCGRVDLIELYDLVRENLGGVRKRELEAHLQGCQLCAQDIKKLDTIAAAMRAIAVVTDVAPSPQKTAHIETQMQKEASEFAGAKARNLWGPRGQTAAPQRSGVRSRLVREVKAASKALVWAPIFLCILFALIIAAFRWGILKDWIWPGIEVLPRHSYVAKVFGIADREEAGRIIKAFPSVSAGTAERLSDASRWLHLMGAPPAEVRFIELVAQCAGLKQRDKELLGKAKAIWDEAEGASSEQSLAIFAEGNELLSQALSSLAGGTGQREKAQEPRADK
jgi:hypothetical protein